MFANFALIGSQASNIKIMGKLSDIKNIYQ